MFKAMYTIVDETPRNLVNLINHYKWLEDQGLSQLPGVPMFGLDVQFNKIYFRLYGKFPPNIESIQLCFIYTKDGGTDKDGAYIVTIPRDEPPSYIKADPDKRYKVYIPAALIKTKDIYYRGPVNCYRYQGALAGNTSEPLKVGDTVRNKFATFSLGSIKTMLDGDITLLSNEFLLNVLESHGGAKRVKYGYISTIRADVYREPLMSEKGGHEEATDKLEIVVVKGTVIRSRVIDLESIIAKKRI